MFQFSNLYLYTNERTNPIQSFYELLLTKLILVYEIEPFTYGDEPYFIINSRDNTFGDFDSDGRQDLYMVGMSSTTARRLDQLGLKREDYPEYTKLRAPMAYGNRMYVAREGKYVQTPLNQDCARAGWAWGAASFDLENDGDDDLYVANGHISGKSATDYCTAFWRHDLYTGSSTEDPAEAHLLSDRVLPPRQLVIIVVIVIIVLVKHSAFSEFYFFVLDQSVLKSQG
mgnify:CR=1 FL=1